MSSQDIQYITIFLCHTTGHQLPLHLVQKLENFFENTVVAFPSFNFE